MNKQYDYVYAVVRMDEYKGADCPMERGSWSRKSCGTPTKPRRGCAVECAREAERVSSIFPRSLGCCRRPALPPGDCRGKSKWSNAAAKRRSNAPIRSIPTTHLRASLRKASGSRLNGFTNVFPAVVLRARRGSGPGRRDRSQGAGRLRQGDRADPDGQMHELSRGKVHRGGYDMEPVPGCSPADTGRRSFPQVGRQFARATRRPDPEADTMPPKDAEPPSPRELALVKLWIDQGAKGAGGVTAIALSAIKLGPLPAESIRCGAGNQSAQVAPGGRPRTSIQLYDPQYGVRLRGVRRPSGHRRIAGVQPRWQSPSRPETS